MGSPRRPSGRWRPSSNRFFGLRDFGGIIGVQSPFLALGMAIAPPLVGLCYDRLGRYEPALLVMVGMMAATIVIYLMLGPYRYRRDLVAMPPPG
jgi:MFS family permease